MLVTIYRKFIQNKLIPIVILSIKFESNLILKRIVLPTTMMTDVKKNGIGNLYACDDFYQKNLLSNFEQNIWYFCSPFWSFN